MLILSPAPSKNRRLFRSPTSGSRKYKWRPSKITSSGGVIGTNSKRWYTYDIIIYNYIYDISELSDLWNAKQTTPTAICAFFKPRCQDESHRVTMSSCRVTSCAECRDCLRSAAKHGSLRSWLPAGWFTKCNLSAMRMNKYQEKKNMFNALDWFIVV